MVAPKQATVYISMMDVDLVTGAFRAILALHTEGEDGSCVDCLSESPCPTVRIIAAFQDAAIERGANGDEDPETRNRRETHAFLYPECPAFSGGICHEHKGLPMEAAS